MAEPWYIDTTSEGVLKAKVPYGDEFLNFQPREKEDRKKRALPLKIGVELIFI